MADFRSQLGNLKMSLGKPMLKSKKMIAFVKDRGANLKGLTLANDVII